MPQVCFNKLTLYTIDNSSPPPK